MGIFYAFALYFESATFGLRNAVMNELAVCDVVWQMNRPSQRLRRGVSSGVERRQGWLLHLIADNYSR